MGDEGALSISFQDWPNLEEFYISNNEITGEGLNWLSKKDWKSLKIIHLHDNRIGDDGVNSFIEG